MKMEVEKKTKKMTEKHLNESIFSCANEADRLLTNGKIQHTGPSDP